MTDPATLSKQQLLDLVAGQSKELATRDQELADNSKKEIARDKDIIRQLEANDQAKEKDYLKLWRERFEARSERYIANPDQLRIDFGDTDQSADAADGLAEAVEEADLIPAHLRRKPKKKVERVSRPPATRRTSR